MSEITYDGLARLAQNALQLYPYGNSGRQRVNHEINRRWHHRST